MVGRRQVQKTSSLKWVLLPILQLLLRQEKETITIASATKNEAIIPPLSAFASALFASPVGRVISNAPKNEIANIIKRTAKIIFGIQCVPSTSVASVLWKSATMTPTSV